MQPESHWKTDTICSLRTASCFVICSPAPPISFRSGITFLLASVRSSWGIVFGMIYAIRSGAASSGLLVARILFSSLQHCHKRRHCPCFVSASPFFRISCLSVSTGYDRPTADKGQFIGGTWLDQGLVCPAALHLPPPPGAPFAGPLPYSSPPNLWLRA